MIVTIEENEIASSPEASSSSYEQQYDRKGYPQNLLSEDLDRRSRRAQNDVLATIGVCVQEGQTVHGAPSGHNAISPDQSRIRSLIRENEIGLLISGFDLAFAGIATICAVGLRNRLQVGALPITVCKMLLTEMIDLSLLLWHILFDDHQERMETVWQLQISPLRSASKSRISCP